MSPQDFRDALGLVYRAYRQRRLIPSNRLAIWIRPHHLDPEACTYLATQAREAVGAISIAIDGAGGLPMDACFPRQLDRLRDAGKRLVEATCLANKVGSQDRGGVLGGLMNLVVRTGRARGATHVVAAVHPRHVPFYRRAAGFRAFGKTRPYAGAAGSPATPMIADLEAFTEFGGRVNRKLLAAAAQADTTARVSPQTLRHLAAYLDAIEPARIAV